MNKLSLFFISIFIFISCSENEALDESLINNPDLLTNEDDDIIDIEEEEVDIRSTEVCTYEELGIEAKSTVIIDCLVDLNGQTIDVPENVTFEFDNGDIFNGTLNFSSSGKISGELLSSNLTLEGDVRLINEEFSFDPLRWGIVETSSSNPTPPSLAEAYNNHLILQGTLNYVKNIGATIFSIGRMNAFFDAMNGSTDSVAISTGIILVPSDFSLKMSDKTFIRAYPLNGLYSNIPLRIYRSSNVMVSGGNLIGDRLLHGPDKGGAMGLRIVGGQNVVIDNVNVSYAVDSGLAIQSYLFEDDADYFPSRNVIIKNSTFDSNGKNNIQVTDGYDVIIENCTSYRAGIDVQGAYGTVEGLSPKIGILTETAQMQVVKGVIIRNNVVEESVTRNSILSVGSTDIEISGNTADNFVGWTTALNVSVLNNRAGGVTGGRDDDSGLFTGYDNIVSGNILEYEEGAAMYLTDNDIEVYDNTIINSKVGIHLVNLTDSKIYNNTIKSNLDSTTGVLVQKGMDNVVFRNNTIELEAGKPMNLVLVNVEEDETDHHFYYQDNQSTSSDSGVINGSNYISVTGNEFNNAGFGMSNSSNILVSNNSVITESGNAFSINKSSSSTNIEVSDNRFVNASDQYGSAPGVELKAITNSMPVEENSNINFHDNYIKSTGENYGLYCTDFDGIKIIDNTIETESEQRFTPFYFVGNDSEISGNIIVNEFTNEAIIVKDNIVVEN